MTLQIETELVDFYLREFTVNWFEDNEDAPDDLGEYDDLIDGVRRHLRDENETGIFRTALVYLISAPDDEVARFDGGSGFEPGELRELMRHIYRQIWGDIPKASAKVEFV